MGRTYAIFGLGRYGTAVAGELVKSGAEVIAIDANINAVNAAAAFLPVCKCADVTDPAVIEQLGIANVDVVIIAMGTSLEASVMATMLCKEAGVGTVIAKCSDEMHGKILRRVGADKVVLPENESGIRLAKNLLSSGFMDIMELSRDVSMIELDVAEKWIGRSILELDLRKKYSLNIVALCRGGQVITDIDPKTVLTNDMKLIVIANISKLEKLKL